MSPAPAPEPSLTQLSHTLGPPADGVLFIVEIAGPDAPAPALPVTEPVTAGLLLGLAAWLLRRPKRALRLPR